MGGRGRGGEEEGKRREKGEHEEKVVDNSVRPASSGKAFFDPFLLCCETMRSLGFKCCSLLHHHHPELLFFVGLLHKIAQHRSCVPFRFAPVTL